MKRDRARLPALSSHKSYGNYHQHLAYSQKKGQPPVPNRLSYPETQVIHTPKGEEEDRLQWLNIVKFEKNLLLIGLLF